MKDSIDSLVVQADLLMRGCFGELVGREYDILTRCYFISYDQKLFFHEHENRHLVGPHNGVASQEDFSVC